MNRTADLEPQAGLNPALDRTPLLHNVAEALERPNAPGLRLSRVAAQTRAALNPGAAARAFTTSACELRFLHDAPVTVTLARVPTEWDAGSGQLEVWHGEFPGVASPLPLVGTQSFVLRPAPNLEALAAIAAREGHAFDPRVTRLMLPHDAETHLLGIIGEARPPSPELLPRRMHLAYGSSITAGASAAHGSLGYAARLARALGANLVNLGFPGTAQLEPELAADIAQRDWHTATLELGINVIGHWDADQFAERVHGFLAPIVAAIAQRRVIVTDLFTTFADERQDEKTRQFREIVRDAVTVLAEPRLEYASGLSLLSGQHLTTDGVHPSNAGHAEIAARLAERFAGNP